MTQHTPGPWKAEKRGDFWHIGDDSDYSSIGRIEGEADACLIAEAPELLKRLKFMVRDWIEIVGSEEENSTPADTLEKAKAAIAKAEGR